MKIIRDMWIVHKDGIVIFKRLFDEKIDTVLFGGFLSALNSFAKQIDDEGTGLTSFDMSGKRYAMLKTTDLIFIGNFDVKVKSAKAKKELENVANKFLNKYSEKMIKKNITYPAFFEGFLEQIEESLESVDEKFEQTFW